MRLGDLDKALEELCKYCSCGSYESCENRCVEFLDISNIPTIDAVLVVRCGECERRNKSADLTDTIYCPWLNLQMRKTDFCSYGERKDGGD